MRKPSSEAARVSVLRRCLAGCQALECAIGCIRFLPLAPRDEAFVILAGSSEAGHFAGRGARNELRGGETETDHKPVWGHLPHSRRAKNQLLSQACNPQC